MILSTPYLHVQAIRRMYRDRGLGTFCKAGGYPIVINMVGGGPQVLSGRVTIDRDSDFVWLSSYFYQQDAAWDPNVASNGENPSNGDEPEIRIEILNTGEVLSSPAFIPIAQVDGGLFFKGNEADAFAEAGTSETGFGIWRHYLPEPRIIRAGHSVAVTLRQLFTNGNIFYLAGVRLYVGG